MPKKPVVAVSACLLGQPVRYDGKHKYSSIIADELENFCHLIAVCPEIEIGLGVPRVKIQLTQFDSMIKVLKTDQSQLDVTDLLADFAVQFVKQQALSGMVLQDKSPSCGIDNVKLFSQSGKKIGLNSGLFASTIINLFPGLTVVQASQLQTKEDIEAFLKQMSK